MSFCATAMSAAKTAVTRADPGDHGERRGGSAGRSADLHQRIYARDEIHASRDHRGRVNQRGHRRGAFHRVGQPDVQWKLAALAHGSGKDQQADGSGSTQAQPACCESKLTSAEAFKRAHAVVVEEQRAGLRKQPDDSKQKENIANARGDESFFCSSRSGGLLIPEADEQIRGEANDLPAHEEQQQAVGDDYAQHGSRKKREEAEEAREVFVVGHVAYGIDEDKQADEADHHDHDGGERIEDPAQIDGRGAEAKPCEVDDLANDRPVRPPGHDVTERDQREHQRNRKRPDGERCCKLAARLLQQRNESRSDHGKRGNEPKHRCSKRIHGINELGLKGDAG